MLKPYPLWQFALLLVLFSQFFIGGPNHIAPRSFSALWNLGHVLFFFLLCRCMMLRWPWLGRQSDLAKCAVTAVFAFIVGSAIEGVQSLLANREASVADVALDVFGAFCAWTFFSPLGFSRLFKTCLQVVALIILALCLYPIVSVLIDEYSAKQSFPQLADFETERELGRWRSGERSAEVASSGQHSLRVELSSDVDSMMRFRYFPHDWSGYSSLRLDIFNPATQAVLLECSIHDSHYDWKLLLPHDRFNRVLRLEEGWNYLQIPMQAILAAPRGRLMDLHSIRGLSCVLAKAVGKRVLFVDNVRLVE